MNTVIETSDGLVRGVQEGPARVWRSIPYAQPPVGELRYRAPQPLQSWEGIHDAGAFGPICPQNTSPLEQQLNVQKPEMSEDCLTLNIWALDTKATNRPVMFWIHGGAFVTGSGSTPLYDGQSFAQHGDVIVVTINYRLGAFGFLYLGDIDSSYPANLGLLDQIAALAWVKRNIAAFGGDPERITIFGESAGAMSIASLLTMPDAHGLCRQAILQSGAVQVQSREQASAVTRGVLGVLGITPDNLSALHTLPATALLQAASVVQNHAGSVLVFQPVIDGVTLPQHPLESIRAGVARDVALLIGTNHDEGNLFVPPDAAPGSRELLTQLLQPIVGPTRAPAIVESYAITREGQSELVTDSVFWVPALRLAEQQQAHAPVWMYRFDWAAPSSRFVAGAFHALELPFVWNMLHTPVGLLFTSGAPGPQQLADQMHGAWIAFAQIGNPELSALPAWPHYDLHERPTMIFDTESHVEHDPQPEKRALWMGGA